MSKRETAREHYDRKATQIEALIQELRFRMTAHGQGGHINWGHAGDLDYVAERLELAVTGLSPEVDEPEDLRPELRGVA